MKSVLKFTTLALAAATLLPLMTISADAQQRVRRQVIVVAPPEKIPGFNWYDPLRWGPATATEVRALSRYTRSCADAYALEHRASGTVLTPQMRCRWVRR